jgi:branched-subunit amino acid transport protein AzlD
LHASHPFYIFQPRKRPAFLCVLSKEGASRLIELEFIICVYDLPISQRDQC